MQRLYNNVSTADRAILRCYGQWVIGEIKRMNIKRYGIILWKRLWIIVLLFAVTMSVILVSAVTAKPAYEAAVRLQVIPMESEQVGLYSTIKGSPDSDPIDLTAFQFSQIVRSGSVGWRTIAQLGLNTDAETLLRGIRTSQEYDFITVVALADDPQTAEQIVNTQVENGLTTFRQNRARPAVVTGEFLSQQLIDAEQTLAAAESDLLRFNLNHNLESLEREILAYQDTIRNLRKAQEDTGLEVARTSARVGTLEAEASAADVAARAATPKSDAEADAIRRADALRSAAANLRSDLSGYRAVETGYDRMIARWETELTSLIALTSEDQRLNNAVNLARNRRDFLSAKALEAKLKQQQGLEVGYLKIIEPARRPDQPLPNRTLQIALIGGALSIVAGVILAFLFELIESLKLNRNEQA